MPIEYSIFKPKSKKGIFNDYPELRSFEAFRTLDNNSMLFVWYFACESSPFHETEDDRERVKLSIKESYYKKGIKALSDKDAEKMKSGMFSSKITVAIDEMKKFKVGPRVQALMMVQKGFDNLSKIIDVDVSDSSMFIDKDGEIDFAKKKSYVDSVGKAIDLIPKMINQIEGRFGLTEDKANGQTTFEGESFMDSYHEKQD